MKIVEYKDEYKDQVIELILSIQQKEFGVDITLEDQPDLIDIQTNYQKEGNFWVALIVIK